MKTKAIEACITSSAECACCGTVNDHRTAREELAALVEAARAVIHDWPEDFEHENGNYQRTCDCGATFMGHKRRMTCRKCAMKTHAELYQRASQAEAALAKANAEKEAMRAAIENCVAYANGRETEWGNRAEAAFAYLYRALEAAKAGKGR